ncbi:MAG: pseudouridine synthase, partial [Burkholderiaceae bacterium]
MNDLPDTPIAPDALAHDTASEDAAKPVRRRRTVKPVETEAASVALAPEPGAQAAPGSVADASPDTPAEALAEPAKPRRRRVAATEAVVETVAEAVTAPPASAVSMPPSAGAAAAALASTSVAELSRFAGASNESALAPVDPLPVVASTPGATPPEGNAAPATAPGDESRDSPRSRRRGRRERRRDEGAPEAGAGDAASRPIDASADADADDGSDAEGVERAPAEPALPPPQAEEVFAQVLSGEFDIEEPAELTPSPAAPPKRVLLPDADAPKLHKVLAQAGVGSRRDMEELILDGQITVNGQPAHIGQRISFGDQIKVHGKPVKVRITPPPPRIIAYHKPVGEVVTHDDPQHRPTVFRRLPRLQQGKWQSVGRLDINTEGLLLFTNSGELANQLMHPRFGVEREYAVRVLGTLTPDDRDELMEGVDIDGQQASFRSIEDGGGEGANHWYRVVINEGRNREVRKLFDTQDLTVSRLIRIRYGTVVLPRGLKRGVWVDLEDADVKAIRRLTLGDGSRRDAGPAGRGQDRPGGQNKPRNERQNGRPNDHGGRGPHPNAG